MYKIFLMRNILQSSHPEVDIQYKCQQQPPCTFVTHHFQVLSFTAKDRSTWIILWSLGDEEPRAKAPLWSRTDWKVRPVLEIFSQHTYQVCTTNFISHTNFNIDHSDPLEPGNNLVDQGWPWLSRSILMLIILNLIMLIRAHVRDVHEAVRSHQCRFSIGSK